MTCDSCLKKWEQFYSDKGFNEKEARALAEKLLARIAKRQKKEKNKLLYLRARGKLFKWTFLVNWKATIWNSFLAHRLLWIGKSFNPDYTQVCAGTANNVTCTSDPSDPCPPAGGNCVTGPCIGGTCGCPAPLPNSSQFADNCTRKFTGTCICRVTGVCLRGGNCPCGGNCSYNCDAGFAWNGVACVASTVLLLKRMHVGL